MGYKNWGKALSEQGKHLKYIWGIGGNGHIKIKQKNNKFYAYHRQAYYPEKYLGRATKDGLPTKK